MSQTNKKPNIQDAARNLSRSTQEAMESIKVIQSGVLSQLDTLKKLEDDLSLKAREQELIQQQKEIAQMQQDEETAKKAAQEEKLQKEQAKQAETEAVEKAEAPKEKTAEKLEEHKEATKVEKKPTKVEEKETQPTTKPAAKAKAATKEEPLRPAAKLAKKRQAGEFRDDAAKRRAKEQAAAAKTTAAKKPAAKPAADHKAPQAPTTAAPAEKTKADRQKDNKRSNSYVRVFEDKRVGRDKRDQERERVAKQGGLDVQSRRRRRPRKRQEDAAPKPEPIVIEKATMTGDIISVKALAERIGKPANEIIKHLMILGVIATINNDIDYDTASLVASELGVELEQVIEKTAEDVMVSADFEEEDEENLEKRPPVVTIMGHVDHGKTSLLDAIRSSRVTSGEAGGITQHIGAYTVDVHDGDSVTFLDTPGHEAFTSMRARGAQVTDIAIIVVAADDGIMPQTVEAINHAQAAEVPIIVAINKIDKPESNIERVKQELTEHSLVPEEWGGTTIIVPVSAHTGEGINELLEMILLVAEVQDLKANPNRYARGTIIEAQLDRARGPVATILVQTGTLRQGQTVVAGTAMGRIRAMTNEHGENLEEVLPSQPVEILGFGDVPEAGDLVYAVEEDKLSRQVVEERKDKMKVDKLQAMNKVTLDDLFEQMSEGEIKDLNIIVKADVQGSVEALKQSLEKLSNEEVRVKCIHGGAGAISETDVMLAAASNAIIIGFNVRPDTAVRSAAEKEGVDVRLYRVIYDAIADVENAMKGMLEPVFEEFITGHAEVRETYKASAVGTIAGCHVQDGIIRRNSTARLLRDSVVVYEGKLGSLRRFQDDVREVASGYECGISLENFNDIKVGDIIETFEDREVEVE